MKSINILINKESKWSEYIYIYIYLIW